MGDQRADRKGSGSIAGSIIVLSGAIMLGTGQLAQAIALSGHWDDTPVSMRIIGSLLCVIGLAIIAWTGSKERIAGLSGAILLLAGVAVFAFSKIALTMAS